jgi:transcriptional regulator with XRE-family HTH domain
MQLRALRTSRDWTQPRLAKESGMAQPRISELETPGERKPNIDTLLRIASAFDVALQVRFVPFSEIIDWSEGLDLDAFAVEPFERELESAEKEQSPAAPKKEPKKIEKKAHGRDAALASTEPKSNLFDFGKYIASKYQSLDDALIVDQAEWGGAYAAVGNSAG